MAFPDKNVAFGLPLNESFLPTNRIISGLVSKIDSERRVHCWNSRAARQEFRQCGFKSATLIIVAAYERFESEFICLKTLH